MRYKEEKWQRSLLVEDERYARERLAEKRRMQHELNVMRVLMNPWSSTCPLILSDFMSQLAAWVL